VLKTLGIERIGNREKLNRPTLDDDPFADKLRISGPTEISENRF
jgi:hypothetical protein